MFIISMKQRLINYIKLVLINYCLEKGYCIFTFHKVCVCTLNNLHPYHHPSPYFSFYKYCNVYTLKSLLNTPVRNKYLLVEFT